MGCEKTNVQKANLCNRQPSCLKRETVLSHELSKLQLFSCLLMSSSNGQQYQSMRNSEATKGEWWRLFAHMVDQGCATFTMLRAARIVGFPVRHRLCVRLSGWLIGNPFPEESILHIHTSSSHLSLYELSALWALSTFQMSLIKVWRLDT